MFDGIIRATELFATADDDQIRKNMIVLTDGISYPGDFDTLAAEVGRARRSAGGQEGGLCL